MTRRILVTSALPYANGSIHLGHLVEYIQTDIWVRFQKMRGHECWYVCADDTHGTPVMLRAEKEGITPEALIERMHGEHLRDFAGFQVEFDNYYSTHSDETRRFAEAIFERLRGAGLIDVRPVAQFFDPVRQMFLPDRYVRGECPRCGAPDQYGDSCEVCSAAYSPTELRNPRSAVSGAAPVLKESDHYFFRLSDPRCKEFLKRWIREPGRLQAEAANKLDEWLAGDLADWDISRDPPYFGFEIPGAAGKYFYVWLDAPVGYMGSFQNLCTRAGLDFDDFWGRDSGAELYHFIGKDILYFHALFWPAELENAGFRTPTGIYVHGFLTVNGAKMSKSRGTFITAASYLGQGLNPQWLRYYYAAKLSDSMEDIDLNSADFAARINSDLVGKYVNIASRAAGFIGRRFGGRLAAADPGLAPLAAVREAAPRVSEKYEAREFGKVVREVMLLADQVNQYVDAVKPWELAKLGGKSLELHVACTNALNLFLQLTVLLKPVLPAIAAGVEGFFGHAPFIWEDATKLLPEGHPIRPYEHLVSRVDPKQVAALMNANRESPE
jgi:methionyl-tRNA synthetase